MTDTAPLWGTQTQLAVENFPISGERLHPAFKDLKPEEMIEVGLSAPLHEGAERYYKERGWL